MLQTLFVHADLLSLWDCSEKTIGFIPYVNNDSFFL